MINYSVKSDIVPLIENLVNAIQPFAMANEVSLLFEKEVESFEISFSTESVLSDLGKLVCRIISLSPQHHSVRIVLSANGTQLIDKLKLRISNSGANLAPVKDKLLKDIGIYTQITPLKFGTIFELCFPKESFHHKKTNLDSNHFISIGKYEVSPFYIKLNEHLKTHFTHMSNLATTAETINIHDELFIKKINVAISSRLDQEGFQTETLAKAMALSRSQLYRKMKALTGHSPSKYIRYYRIEKAKQMIESEDLTIGEVAFKTGFMNQSHFTRVFSRQFGFNPSELLKK